MTILVTGSAGHLGEGLMRALRAAGTPALGVDIVPSAYTDRVGSIVDRGFVRRCMQGARAVLHAAALHKPHVATHDAQAFIDVNLTGTLNLLEEAVGAEVGAFVFTSTTSAFGAALAPAPDQPAAWITEAVTPIPKNIYGVTKVAAEDLCQLIHRTRGLPVVVLRTLRFFPEQDDDPAARQAYDLDNIQANELLYRRADLADVVDAHLLAVDQAKRIGFGRFIVSATTPFAPGDLADLRTRAPQVVRRCFPEAEALYRGRGWTLPAAIDRVYVNALATATLGWRPRYDFGHVLRCLGSGEDFRSPLARAVGSKGYHSTVFEDGPYPVA
jgi:UDP-glucose 4-epimerase